LGKKLFKKCVALSRELATFDSLNTQIHLSYLCLRNKIVTYGRNSKYCTEPLAHKYKHRFAARHSELAVIKQFDYPYRTLPRFVMVNVRLNRDLEVLMSKPCTFCGRMLREFEVGSVFYSIDEHTFEQFL
jgi:hypothetical protein